jgi:hypothetical protein
MGVGTVSAQRASASKVPEQLFAWGRGPLAQWLAWEERANLRGFRVSTDPVPLEVVDVPAESLTIDVAPGTPGALVRRFVRGERVLLPKHPLNRDAGVAYFSAPPAERWSARFTSSRTLALVDDLALPISLKLATDHPHPDFAQPEKTRLREEARDALASGVLIGRVDSALGSDPRLRILREAIVMMVRGSESGMLVRDLRPLADGHFYLPGFSLPWCGREIAALHGEAFESFWARHYAASVGRAKALLLARYGLQYETPNPQNLLLQLDARLLPTGQVVLRDVGDADPVVAPRAAVDRPWGEPARALRPETANSFWAFDSDERSIAPEVLEAWRRVHDRAYLAELAGFLELPAALTQPVPEVAFAAISAFLASEVGARHAAEAFERKRRRPAAPELARAVAA